MALRLSLTIFISSYLKITCLTLSQHITETSQKKSNNGFLSNVEIEGFNSYAIASNTSKGGSLLYVNNKYKNREGTDLSIQNDLFEAIWVEIINVGRRNAICFSLYRHPNEINSEYETLIEYLDDSLEKISSKGKDISICGDFNSDWLKAEKIPYIISSMLLCKATIIVCKATIIGSSRRSERTYKHLCV